MKYSRNMNLNKRRLNQADADAEASDVMLDIQIDKEVSAALAAHNKDTYGIKAGDRVIGWENPVDDFVSFDDPFGGVRCD